MNIDIEKTNNFLNLLNTLSLNDISQKKLNKLMDSVNKLIIEPAKTAGMYREVSNNMPRNNSKLNKPWFNGQCKISKANYKRFKKNLPHQQSNADQINLKNMAKKHNRLIRKEKRKYEKKLNAQLKLLKSTNPAAYWNIINKGKKKIQSWKYLS